MDTVTKRELNQDTASVLARVTDTNDITVTEDGVPRWQITTYQPGISDMVDTSWSAELAPPPSLPPLPVQWPSDGEVPKYTEAQITEILDEIRADRDISEIR